TTRSSCSVTVCTRMAWAARQTVPGVTPWAPAHRRSRPLASGVSALRTTPVACSPRTGPGWSAGSRAGAAPSRWRSQKARPAPGPEVGARGTQGREAPVRDAPGQREQVTIEEPLRPPVHDRVVDAPDQVEGLVVDEHQLQPEERPRFRVEAARRHALGQPAGV